MKKSDLKTKMGVETRNGDRYLVVDDGLVSTRGFDMLHNYDDDLKYIDGKLQFSYKTSAIDLENYDIVKVYKFNNEYHKCTNGCDIYSKTFLLEFDEWELIWERKKYNFMEQKIIVFLECELNLPLDDIPKSLFDEMCKKVSEVLKINNVIMLDEKDLKDILIKILLTELYS